MMELREKLIEIFEDSSFAPYTFEELLTITNFEKEQLKEILDQLKDENIVYESKTHLYDFYK